MRVAVAVAVSGVAACAVGGGPFVGYSKKQGMVYGAEGSFGIGYLQNTIGFDLDGRMFDRFDVGLDNAVVAKHVGLWGAGRFGVGWIGQVGPGPAVDSHVTAIAAGGVLARFHEGGCSHPHEYTTTLELQLRYAEDWIVAVAPHFDFFDNTCFE
jgi:hypothetical protein